MSKPLFTSKITSEMSNGSSLPKPTCNNRSFYFHTIFRTLNSWKL